MIGYLRNKINWAIFARTVGEYSAQALAISGVDDRQRNRMLSETIRDRYE